MENKLQELTKKLYDEGLEKGRAEADRLVGEAKNEAAKIVAEARAQDQVGDRFDDRGQGHCGRGEGGCARSRIHQGDAARRGQELERCRCGQGGTESPAARGGAY